LRFDFHIFCSDEESLVFQCERAQTANNCNWQNTETFQLKKALDKSDVAGLGEKYGIQPE
jgi:hypothetical protein